MLFYKAQENMQRGLHMKHLSSMGAEVIFVNAVTAGGSVKFFTSGVNFSRNNTIYKINESTKYILS